MRRGNPTAARVWRKIMTTDQSTKSSNAWIAIDHSLAADLTLAPYTLRLKGERSLYQAIADDDWVLILHVAGHITRVGRVLRVRSDLETTTIYFDRMLSVDPAVPIGLTSLTPPSAGSVGRIQWTDFLVRRRTLPPCSWTSSPPRWRGCPRS